MSDETRTEVEREEPALATVDQRPLSASPRISWGAVFGGAFAALGIWLLLYALGLAIGLTAMDPNDPHSARGSGIFTGIWSGISPLVALFVGGLVAGRLAGVFLRGYGALHGLVMWGLVTVSGAFMVFTVASSLVAGTASLGKSVVQGGGAAIKEMAGRSSGSMASLGVDWNDVLAPINARLQSQGKPPVSAAQLEAAARDSLQSSIRAGHFDRDQFEATIAQRTALSRADVQQIGNEIEQRFDSAAQSAETAALKAADVTGKTFWWVFIALALGLIAALGGGIVGVPRVRAVRGGAPEPSPRPAKREPAPRGPMIPPREAYRRT
jgi:hypothetical protein